MVKCSLCSDRRSPLCFSCKDPPRPFPPRPPCRPKRNRKECRRCRRRGPTGSVNRRRTPWICSSSSCPCRRKATLPRGRYRNRRRQRAGRRWRPAGGRRSSSSFRYRWLPRARDTRWSVLRRARANTTGSRFLPRGCSRLRASGLEAVLRSEQRGCQEFPWCRSSPRS